MKLDVHTRQGGGTVVRFPCRYWLPFFACFQMDWSQCVRFVGCGWYSVAVVVVVVVSSDFLRRFGSSAWAGRRRLCRRSLGQQSHLD